MKHRSIALILITMIGAIFFVACQAMQQAPSTENYPEFVFIGVTETPEAENLVLAIDLAEVDQTNVDPKNPQPALMISLEGFPNPSKVKIVPPQGESIEFDWDGRGVAFLEHAGEMSLYGNNKTIATVNNVVYTVSIGKFGEKVTILYLTPDPQ